MYRLFFIVVLSGLILGCARAPQGLDTAQVTKQINADLQLLGTAQARPEKPLTLYNAIARAILYNREYKLSVMEAALSQRQYDLAKTNMLPALTLSAGYSSRDKYAASASTTFDGDEPAALGASPSYSVSQDKTRTTGSAALTWNVLDFGLSYVRAGQAADRRMVAIERQRKVVHNIVREVTYAYWRAVAAENLLSDLGPLLRRVEKALADSRNIEARRLSSPIEALIYQKELLEIRRTLHTQQRSLMTARLELAQLMGMLPGQDYRLAPVEYIIPEIAMNMSLMENTALLSRPELMEARYQSRISRSEVRAAMYSMFPSLNLTATANSDDSDYQLYNDYVEMGATLSWNLMSVFNGPANRRVAKAQVGVAEQQRLALAMAVISQVHIANLNFVQSRQEYAVAEEFLSVSQRLTKQTRDAQKVAKFGELEVIRQEASLLLATLRRDIAFAELQNSFSTVYASVGLDIVPEQLTDLSAETLTTAITKSLQTWGLKYKSVMAESGRVLKPIADQNPVLGPQGFTFASDTFDVGRPVRYMLGMQSGAPLPDWLRFDEADRRIFGTPPENAGDLNLRLVAQGPQGRASDSFILRIGTATKVQPVVAQPAPAVSSPAPLIVPPVAPPVTVSEPQPQTEEQPAELFVQAKALTTRADALAYAEEIKDRVGMQAFVRKTRRRKVPLYRVIIPAFSTDGVIAIQQSLELMGVTDSFVVTR